MHAARAVLWATAVAIVALALATGPLLGLLSVPAGGLSGGETPGSGTANVTVLSAPDRATLSAGTYGDVYYLTVPPTTVSVSNVSGSPYLTVSAEVEEVWISRTSVYRLRPGERSDRALSMGRATFDDVTVDNETIPGRLSVSLHDGDGITVIYDEPLDVEVEG